MSLADSAALARFPPFRDRVTVAMMTAAKDVAAETVSDGETYRLRRALAVNVLLDPDAHAARFAWAVVTNPVITFDSPDDAIQYTINSLWNGIAGAPPDPPA